MTSRRRFVTVTGTVALAGVPGCATVADWIADVAMGDVNLFNESDVALAGTVDIVDPDGETVLEEAFELAAGVEDDENDADGEGVTSYDGVWTTAGAYDASVTLDDGDVRGDAETSSSVTIDDPEAEMLAVVFGADEFDDGIVFTTAENWSGFDRG